MKGARRHVTGLTVCLAVAALWQAGGRATAQTTNAAPERQAPPRTEVTIPGGGPEFHVNGTPTYAGRSWKGHKVEGLLFNARLVQATFDDLNPATARRWAYSDTGKWDADRNTRELLEMLPEYRRHGLIAFTINFQGGSPQGYSKEQPWHNSGFSADGSLRADYLSRLDRVLDRADELGMVVIVGYFYFGQDHRLDDESAVVRAVDNLTLHLLERDRRNVLVEINNECDVRYRHEILKPGRVHELIRRVASTRVNSRRLLVSTSYSGNSVPSEAVAAASDFILLHGNGVHSPEGMTSLIRRARAVASVGSKPIVVNEDDHFDFDRPTNNFTATLAEYASWGYFDYRKPGEPPETGFQSVPVDWRINTPRKQGFFNLLREITGGQ